MLAVGRHFELSNGFAFSHYKNTMKDFLNAVKTKSIKRPWYFRLPQQLLQSSILYIFAAIKFSIGLVPKRKGQ
jgi:hypothetical protein